MYCNVNVKSVTGALYSIKSYSLSYSWTIWWTVRWLKQCHLQFAAELQQRRRTTNRRLKSIPRSNSSYWEGSITQRGASCGRYNQPWHRSTPKTPTWTYISVRWRVSARYDGTAPIRRRYSRTHNRNWILSGTFNQCTYVCVADVSAAEVVSHQLHGCCTIVLRLRRSSSACYRGLYGHVAAYAVTYCSAGDADTGN